MIDESSGYLPEALPDGNGYVWTADDGYYIPLPHMSKGQRKLKIGSVEAWEAQFERGRLVGISEGEQRQREYYVRVYLDSLKTIRLESIAEGRRQAAEEIARAIEVDRGDRCPDCGGKPASTGWERVGMVKVGRCGAGHTWRAPKWFDPAATARRHAEEAPEHGC